MAMPDDLIERLEKVAEPDRELDGRIWAEIEGRDVRVAWCEHWRKDGLLAKRRQPPHDECVVGVFMQDKLYTVGQSNPPLAYTESIDAALTLLPEDCKWELGYSHHVPCVAGIFVRGVGLFNGECDSNHAIALCIAALRARATIAAGDA